MRRLRRFLGILAAASLLAGCLPRPTLPVQREPRHPFPEDQRGALERTPAIHKPPFAPETFPREQFDYSQRAPLPPLPSAPPIEPVVPLPPEVVKREPLADAVQCILESRHDEAVRHLQAYDPQTQDWFLRLLPALSILTRKKIQDLDSGEVAVLHEQLYTLLAALRPKTELTITKACFCVCDSIKGYGDYKPLPDGYAFAAWSGTRPGEYVQLYVEVRNFASELRRGQYETRLASSVEIRDASGKQMWFHRFEDGKQPRRRRTQIYEDYNSYAFYIPPNMPAGTYSLIVQVADETNPEIRRVTQKTLELRVAATPLRAALP
jgi:hypothetical protein